MIDAFPGAFAEALLASTLLMVFVLGIRRPVARRFGAHVAYALWALPALRH
jgi:beta-lactamase regulating signal transducer with metallopeptidase domain